MTAGAAGAMIGLLLHLHTYVAIFGAIVTTLWFAVAALRGVLRPRLLLVVAAAVVLGGAGVALGPGPPIATLAVVAASGPVGLLLVSAARRTHGLRLLLFSGAATAVAAPALVRLAHETRRPDSFLATRQASAAARDLALPVLPVLFHSLPVLALCGVALARARRSRSGVAPAWTAAVLAIAVGTVLLTFNHVVLLTFNHVLGVNQEPYRFLPYGYVLLAAFSIPSLGRSNDQQARRLSSAVLAVLPLSTLPTLGRFVDETRAVRRLALAESVAFQKIANAAGHEGLMLLDGCLPRGAFKAATGARIAAFNPGLAVPDRASNVEGVVVELRHGRLVDDDALRAAGVSSFLQFDGCRGPTTEELIARFGLPVSAVELHEPKGCPITSARLHLFRVEPSSHGPTIDSSGRRFPPPSGSPPSSSQCVLGSGRDDIL